MQGFIHYIAIPCVIIFVGWVAIYLEWSHRDEKHKHEDWKREMRKIRERYRM